MLDVWRLPYMDVCFLDLIVATGWPYNWNNSVILQKWDSRVHYIDGIPRMMRVFGCVFCKVSGFVQQEFKYLLNQLTKSFDVM